MLKFSSINQVIQYLSDFSNSRVIIAAPVLSKLVPKLSQKYNIDESKILELASADPTYKGNPDKNQSKLINNIIEFYKEDNNLNLEKTKNLIKEFNNLRGKGKLKQSTKLPLSLEELNLILEVKDNLILHSNDKFKPFENSLVDTDGQYRVFEIDGSVPYNEENPFVKEKTSHPWCVKDEGHYSNYSEIPMYLFTKGNEFYALLAKNHEFNTAKNGQSPVDSEYVKPIVELIRNNNLTEEVKGITAWKTLKFDLMSKEELSKEDPDILNLAIKTKDKEEIKQFLDAGAKINEYSLNSAIDTKDKEKIKLILNAGAKPDDSEENSNTLNIAIRTKDKEITKMILDAGAKPNEYTLMHSALRAKDKETIKLILDVGIIKPNGDSLNEATSKKNKEMIKQILDAGAKPNKYTLNYAIQTRDKDIIKQLLNAGIKPNNSADYNNSLNEAIKTKDKEIIKLTLEAGAKVTSEGFHSNLDRAIDTEDKEIIDMIEAVIGNKEASIKFSSINQAIQYLSNYTGNSIKIATEEEDQEYKDILLNYYNNDKKIVDLIMDGENTAKQGLGNSNIKTEKSDSGNTYIRYIESGKNIAILGMISKTGKLVKEDVKNLKSWMNKLLDKIKNGYKVLASTNDFSKPILDKIVKMAEKEGIELESQNMGSFNYNGINWDNLVLYPKS